jgi:hypothetical protein
MLDESFLLETSQNSMHPRFEVLPCSLIMMFFLSNNEVGVAVLDCLALEVVIWEGSYLLYPDDSHILP